MSLRRATLTIQFTYEFMKNPVKQITSSCNDLWAFNRWTDCITLISRADGLHEHVELFYFDGEVSKIKFVTCHVGVEQILPIYDGLTELFYYVKSTTERTLSNDLQNYLSTDEEGDVSFVTREGTILKSHSLILKARSSFFKLMFSSGLIEAESKRVDFTCYPESLVRDFLHFIVHDRVLKLEENACDLLILADMYQLEKLKKDCEYFLASRINHTNSPVIAQVAERVNSEFLLKKIDRFLDHKHMPM